MNVESDKSCLGLIALILNGRFMFVKNVPKKYQIVSELMERGYPLDQALEMAEVITNFLAIT